MSVVPGQLYVRKSRRRQVTCWIFVIAIVGDLCHYIYVDTCDAELICSCMYSHHLVGWGNLINV